MNYKDWFGVPQGSATKPVTPADKLNYGIGVGMGALGLVGTMAGNLAGNKQELSQLKAADVGATSKADLASQIAGYTPTQLGRESLWASGLSGLASGAGAGVAAGGVGAIVGGVLGAASGVIGSSGRNRQKKLTEQRLYTDQMNKFNSANAMLTEQSLSNALTNYAAYGGQFNVPTTYNQGLIAINNGGSHTQNPLGGVPYGIGANGKQNFVEEGETIHNGYVFSDRLTVFPQLTKPLGLPPKMGNKSFSKAATLISKESKERPHDPISRLTKDVLLGRLEQMQDITRQVAFADKAKQPLANGNYFTAGGEAQTRLSQVGKDIVKAMEQIGRAPSELIGGLLNQTYWPIMQSIYPSLRNAPKAQSTNIPPVFGTSLGQQSLPIQQPLQLLTSTQRVQSAAPLTTQTTVAPTKTTPKTTKSPQLNEKARIANMRKFNTENPLPKAPEHNFTNPLQALVQNNLSFAQKRAEVGMKAGLPRKPNPQFDFNLSELGMLAPALGNLATMLSYAGSPAEQVSIPRISAGQRLNEYAPYNPIDTNYLASQLKGQSAGVRRGILDLAGGNRGAATSGLIAADQNYLGALADSYLKASEYNRAQQMQNLQFTNQARQANAQMGLREQIYNQQAGLQEQQMNSANRAARRAGILGGIQAIGNNIGEVSRYNKNLRTIRNAYLYNEEGQLIGI